MRLKRSVWLFVLAGVIAIFAGAYARLWQEFHAMKIEAAAQMAAIVAQADSRERGRLVRIADLFQQGNPNLDRETAERYADFVDEAAERYGLPHEVLAGLIYTESRADPGARNKDCLGLTQVRWTVWGKLLRENHPDIYERRDLFNPRKSVMAGAWILRYYLDRSADLKQALRRYSGGAAWYPDKVMTVARSL
jgi:soluble lytic murein transglycosylase-like protein